MGSFLSLNLLARKLTQPSTILTNPDVRTHLPAVSEWPTFPQLFIGGELVGGCDIIVEMYEAGELQPMIKGAAAAAA